MRRGQHRLLLADLRRTIGGAPTVDVGKFMERYFFIVKRDKGEPMSSYVARENNSYNDFCKSVMRLLHQQETLPGSSAAAPPGLPEPTRAPAARPRPAQIPGADAEDREEEEDDDRTQQDPSEAVLGCDRDSAKLYEVLPEPVRAWLLLRRAGRPATYRANVIDQIQGKFIMEKIASKLRGAWSDMDVVELDRSANASTSRIN